MEESIEPMTVESAMKESASVFEGHPAEGEIEVKPDEPEIKPDEKLEKPEEKKPAFKYVSQGAAEDAYKEAESLIGKKADEAKRERERAEDLQRQLNDALVKIARVEPEPKKPTSTDRMKALLEKVNGLDPEDEDYHLKVAGIWGQREDEIQANIDAKVKEALDSYDKRVKEAQSKVSDELSTQKKIVSDAEIVGTKAGLNMKDGSDDSELFWAFADKAPEGSIEDQIKWTVDKVKGIKTTIATPLLKAGDKAKTIQEQNAVLERGGHKPVEKAVPETPLGLGDAFTQIQRRI